MKETFDTLEQALERVAQIDKEMGFPDYSSGTLTWCIPEMILDDDGKEVWEIPIPKELYEHTGDNTGE